MRGSVLGKLVPVYRLNQSVFEQPAYFVEWRKAKSMVTDKAAVLVKRGAAVRLTFQKPENLRDESCCMGPATIFAYARGNERAIAAVEGWR
jgi:hypothetical protein